MRAFTLALSVFHALFLAHWSYATTVDFEEFELNPDSDLRAVFDDDGQALAQAFFETEGLMLSNKNAPWGFSGGFMISTRGDTMTPGFDPTKGEFGEVVNDSSSFAGGGSGDSDHFAIGFGYLDDLNPMDVDQLSNLPHVVLPEDQQIVAAQFTNTTWAGISMQKGDGFAKIFGGTSGVDPDFFRLTIYGSENGVPLSESVDFFLADYRSEDRQEDFVLNEWQRVDLTPLSSADRLYFNLDSSDIGDFGMNTPAYFAIDNIELTGGSIFGDVSGDGVLDVADIDQVCSAVSSMNSSEVFDVDGDGSVTQGDVVAALDAASRLSGDMNFDGDVNFADFLLLSASFGETASWSSGDLDCDGTAQFSDFLVLSDNFGQVSAAESHSVPEPAAALQFVTLAILYATTRKRRRINFEA